MQHGYLELKLSWELFQKAPETLSEPERSRLFKVAEKQGVIEQSILGCAESAHIIIPAATLAARMGEIRKRYASDDDYAHDLSRSGLSEASLGAAVERDLRVESLLEKIASATEPASPIDAEIYYRLHREAFDRPEARQLRHILITCENTSERAMAFDLLESLRSTVKTAEKFAEAALRHSQCPTAMDGGKLGVVKRKQLYAELEPSAFTLREGEISQVLESPIGAHILRCDTIFMTGMLPFSEVRQQIIVRLTEQRRQKAQREWIKRLLSTRAEHPA